MHFQRKIVLGRLVIITLLVILVIGCNKVGISTSSYIQDVIPVQQQPAFWYLSPLGDKLLYNTTLSQNEPQAIIRVLTTNQEFIVAECSRFSWLDNEHIYCYDFYDDDYKPFVVTVNTSLNADDLQKSLIKEITTEQVELDELLEQAKAIYRLSDSTQPDVLLILDTKNANQYYHVTGVKNLDQVLDGITHTTISLSGQLAGQSQKVYSPNGKYYYLLKDNLGIYDGATDQLLAEFMPPAKYRSWFQFGGFSPNKTEGWAADNSGICYESPPPPPRWR